MEGSCTGCMHTHGDCCRSCGCLTNAGFAELSAALATGCSAAAVVCRRAAESACGACEARNRPGSARRSMYACDGANG